MKDTGAAVRGLNKALSIPGGGLGRVMAQGNVTVMAANAIMAIGQITDRYHREHYQEILDANDRAFREELGARLDLQAKTSNMSPEMFEDVLTRLGRNVLVHFYDADELKAALVERENAKNRLDPNLKITRMERDAAMRYLELRFLDEVGWKPRWSYLSRGRPDLKFPVVSDELIYTAPNGKQTVTSVVGGNLANADRKETKMSRAGHLQWANKLGETVTENHQYDVKAPVLPDFGMRVNELPKVLLVRSARLRKGEPVDKIRDEILKAREKKAP